MNARTKFLAAYVVVAGGGLASARPASATDGGACSYVCVSFENCPTEQLPGGSGCAPGCHGATCSTGMENCGSTGRFQLNCVAD